MRRNSRRPLPSSSGSEPTTGVNWSSSVHLTPDNLNPSGMYARS